MRKACPHARMSAHPRRLRRIPLNRRRTLSGSLVRDCAHCALQRSRGSHKWRRAHIPLCRAPTRLPAAAIRASAHAAGARCKEFARRSRQPCSSLRRRPDGRRTGRGHLCSLFFGESTPSVSETRPQSIVKSDNGGWSESVPNPESKSNSDGRNWHRFCAQKHAQRFWGALPNHSKIGPSSVM